MSKIYTITSSLGTFMNTDQYVFEIKTKIKTHLQRHDFGFFLSKATRYHFILYHTGHYKKQLYCVAFDDRFDDPLSLVRQ